MTDIRQSRKHLTAEEFTPPALVSEILDKLPEELWKDPNKTWLDNSAGNGNFLVEVKKRLEAAGHTADHILNHMLFAVELMPDNCIEMIERLYGPGEILQIGQSFTHNGNAVRNIVCADALKYDYSFGRQQGIEEFLK